MPIYRTNQEAEDLAREVAALTGETITDAVIEALRDRREKLRGPSHAELRARLLAITSRTAAAIGGRAVDADGLYDESGAPR
jgi:antitoxin VapB